MRHLLLLLLLAGCDPNAVDPQTAATCESELDADPQLVPGQLVDAVFTPLDVGEPLPVHAGGQGGFHSDLVFRLRGPAADTAAAGALTTTADMGDWVEEQFEDLVPRCQNHGTAGWFHQTRLFWSGPGCGEDPCDESGYDSEECYDYEDCQEMEDYGMSSLSRSWLIGFDAAIEVRSTAPGLELSERVDGVDLVEGGTEEGEFG